MSNWFDAFRECYRSVIFTSIICDLNDNTFTGIELDAPLTDHRIFSILQIYGKILNVFIY